ncbi:MAG TPA: D-alanyl-D-alanine carboxypeptidase [Solirubrobacteraceae bacterium]|nr:D-alanyl-D-alanine carboxypeptidase [Solirubrobacteraceae bacterium]
MASLFPTHAVRRALVRVALAASVALAAGACVAPAALGSTGELPAGLTRSLNAGMRSAGASSSAEVEDLSTGATLYSHDATIARIPASVEKLYTTSTALQVFGPTARLSTSVLGSGVQTGSTWKGALYLRGGGDPTFGSAAFDHRAYGTGATVQGLVAQLRAEGIRTVTGPIIADASLFDSDEGTPATNNKPSIWVEGALSALSFNRDWADSTGEVYYANPPLQAGKDLVAALRSGGIAVRNRTVRTGVTPPLARQLASVQSPTMATLIALTNTPSDNFFAETLLKDIGAHAGSGGTTADGAAVVRSTIAAKFGLHPYLIDGSGLSYRDHTSPAQVVSLLSGQSENLPFRESLATVGETGTLADENRGTYAQGRCTGKSGTLSDVSNVVGYCRAADGHLLAYAFLMNRVNPDAAHPIQDRMEVAVARYDG